MSTKKCCHLRRFLKKLNERQQKILGEMAGKIMSGNVMAKLNFSEDVSYWYMLLDQSTINIFSDVSIQNFCRSCNNSQLHPKNSQNSWNLNNYKFAEYSKRIWSSELPVRMKVSMPSFKKNWLLQRLIPAGTILYGVLRIRPFLCLLKKQNMR